MALVTKVQKLKDKKQHNTHYDSLYGALIYLSDYPIPLTKTSNINKQERIIIIVNQATNQSSN